MPFSPIHFNHRRICRVTSCPIHRRIHPPQPLILRSSDTNGVNSSVGVDLNAGFGVGYFSPPTPAATGLLSRLGTGNTTTTSTGPVGTRRARQTEKDPEGRASGLLAPLPSATIGSSWSPHTLLVPEGLEGVIEEAVVEEPEEVSMKETEYLQSDNQTHSLITTIATDGHSGPHPGLAIALIIQALRLSCPGTGNWQPKKTQLQPALWEFVVSI